MRARSTTRCPLMPSSTRTSSTLTAASLAPCTRKRIWSIASRAIWRRDMFPALYIARPKWYALEPAISVRSRSKNAAAVTATPIPRSGARPPPLTRGRSPSISASSRLGRPISAPCVISTRSPRPRAARYAHSGPGGGAGRGVLPAKEDPVEHARAGAAARRRARRGRGSRRRSRPSDGRSARSPALPSPIASPRCHRRDQGRQPGRDHLRRKVAVRVSGERARPPPSHDSGRPRRRTPGRPAASTRSMPSSPRRTSIGCRPAPVCCT